MGAGTSKKKRVKRKVEMVGKLEVIYAKRDTELVNCGDVSFTDTSFAWAELRQGKVPDCNNLPKSSLKLSDFNKVHREKTVFEEGDNIDMPPYRIEEKVKPEELCHICGVYTWTEVYPCRICFKVFHEGCLRKIGQVQDQASTSLLHRAKTPTGWTCHNCDNLSNLLTQEELLKLIETFDTYDVNQDASISLEEFIDYRQHAYKQTHSNEMTKDDKENELLKFKQMDSDQTDNITWWEFLNYESIQLLSTRHKASIVKLLTPRELDLAREMFRLFDENDDGEITKYEARKALASWYTLFLRPKDSFNGYAIFCDHRGSNLVQYLRDRLKFVMDADTDNNGTITWQEYIQEQAVYIVASRPNSSGVPMDTSKLPICITEGPGRRSASDDTT